MAAITVTPADLETNNIAFETTTCTRCGGCGEYSFNQIDGKRCYGCHGTGLKLSRAGAAARKRYDAVMDEMHTPVTEIKVGDLAMFSTFSGAKFWSKVTGSHADELNAGHWTIETMRRDMAYSVGHTAATGTQKVWSSDIRLKAVNAVINLKGAHLTPKS